MELQNANGLPRHVCTTNSHLKDPQSKKITGDVTSWRFGFTSLRQFWYPTWSWGFRHPTKTTKTNHPEDNWKTTLVEPQSCTRGDTERFLKYRSWMILISFAIAISSLRKKAFNRKPGVPNIVTETSTVPGFKTPQPSECLHQARAPLLVGTFVLGETWVDATDLTG